MAFIGQETVRKQQRHNFLWRMYTLIAVFVHFNRFIDLKINFHTNPYNLASSMLLWFWAPCGKACLHRGGGRQVGKVTCLNRVMRLSISSLFHLYSSDYVYIIGKPTISDIHYMHGWANSRPKRLAGLPWVPYVPVNRPSIFSSVLSCL